MPDDQALPASQQSPGDDRGTDSTGHLADIDGGPTQRAMDELLAEVIPEEAARIRTAGFGLLLENGQPVRIEHLSALAGVPVDRVVEIFHTMGARGQVELDDQGRLIGLAGLTLTPGRHELTIDGTKRWTWCALDAVGILGALEKSGTVRSSDAHSGATLEIEFADGRAQSDVHLFILGGYAGASNVREDWCRKVNFFANSSEAQNWASARGLDGDVVTIADIVEDTATMWRTVVSA